MTELNQMIKQTLKELERLDNARKKLFISKQQNQTTAIKCHSKELGVTFELSTEEAKKQIHEQTQMWKAHLAELKKLENK